MSNVKLSGKPLGATHYSTYGGCANWYKLDGKSWKFWFDGSWHSLSSPTPQQAVIEIVDVETFDEKPMTSDERRQSKDREKACDEMFAIMLKVKRPGNRSDMAEALYDRGWRKIEIKE